MTRPKNPRPCCVPGCKKPRRGGVYCETHYYRMRRYGSVKKRPRDKIYDASKSIAEHLTDKFLRGIRRLENGCWVCDTAIANPRTGYCDVVIDRGYSIGGKKFRQYAHRLSYSHFKGAIPRGRHVCHSCDNPPCCNPDHLFAGSRQDNMQDMVAKGRHYRGQNNRKAFLSDADVLAIYSLFDNGESQYSIARRFGLNERTVWSIVHGRCHKYLYTKHRLSRAVA